MSVNEDAATTGTSKSAAQHGRISPAASRFIVQSALTKEDGSTQRAVLREVAARDEERSGERREGATARGRVPSEQRREHRRGRRIGRGDLCTEMRSVRRDDGLEKQGQGTGSRTAPPNSAALRATVEPAFTSTVQFSASNAPPAEHRDSGSQKPHGGGGMQKIGRDAAKSHLRRRRTARCCRRRPSA